MLTRRVERDSGDANLDHRPSSPRGTACSHRRLPGVRIEEDSSEAPRPIEGVGTAVAAFIGRAAGGPIGDAYVRSWSDFSRRWAGASPLGPGGRGFLPQRRHREAWIAAVEEISPEAVRGAIDGMDPRATLVAIVDHAAASPDAIAAAADALADRRAMLLVEGSVARRAHRDRRDVDGSEGGPGRHGPGRRGVLATRAAHGQLRGGRGGVAARRGRRHDRPHGRHPRSVPRTGRIGRGAARRRRALGDRHSRRRRGAHTARGERDPRFPTHRHGRVGRTHAVDRQRVEVRAGAPDVPPHRGEHRARSVMGRVRAERRAALAARRACRRGPSSSRCSAKGPSRARHRRTRSS